MESLTLNHLYQYTIVSKPVDYVKKFSVTNALISRFNETYALISSKVIPTPIKSLASRVDGFGDSILSKVDVKIPLVESYLKYPLQVGYEKMNTLLMHPLNNHLEASLKKLKLVDETAATSEDATKDEVLRFKALENFLSTAKPIVTTSSENAKKHVETIFDENKKKAEETTKKIVIPTESITKNERITETMKQIESRSNSAMNLAVAGFNTTKQLSSEIVGKLATVTHTPASTETTVNGSAKPVEIVAPAGFSDAASINSTSEPTVETAKVTVSASA